MWKSSSQILSEKPTIVSNESSQLAAQSRALPTKESNKSEACKRYFEQQQADYSTTIRMIDPNAKTRSYGGTQIKSNSTNKSLHQQQQQQPKPQTRRPNQARPRRYSANRIHRTSSLNRFEDPVSVRKGHDLKRGPAERDEGDGDDASNSSSQSVCLSDIIGSFGRFQLLVLLFSGLREGLVGYDALILSVILQPETRFLCADNLPLDFSPSNSSHPDNFERALEFSNRHFGLNRSANPDSWNETAQCFRSADGGRTPLLDALGQPLQCSSWVFANETVLSERSLVAQWSLVCQNHWLVAFIESAYFFGLVAGNLTWGYYADKLGRRPAYLAAHAISLVFGSLAVVMPNIVLFTLCRFLSAFGSIGYNIIYSIQVELIGSKHRSFSTTLNHLGWGLGVICIPLVDHLLTDYRPIIALAPLLSLAMFPWAFWLPESPRWLMANGHFELARRELLRVAKFNGRELTGRVEKDLFALEQKVRADKLQQKALHADGYGEEKKSYHLIFTTPALLSDTLILSYSAFLGHLFYYVQTINFAYMKNLSAEANFITSGAGEWVSVLIGAILLKISTRKSCMSLFLFIMASSFAFQSVIDSDWLPGLDSVIITTTNNGVGTLSSLLLVFVVLIVNQEVYPTVVRQTGTSITNTVGESGSTLAPLLIQFSRIVGPSKANAIYTVFCTLGIVAVQFVTRTDDIDLPDT